MSNSWIENSFILAIFLLIAGGIINVIIGYGLKVFGLDVSYVNDLGFLLVAYVLGVFYTKKIRQVMPSGLRLKTIGLFLVFYLLIVTIFAYFISQGNLFVLILGVVVGSFIVIIEGLVMYWFFGFGGKIYMKNLEKSNIK